MKKLSTIIMALALVLGMSQCKKQETPTTGNTTPTNPGVRITVNVGDQDGKDGKDGKDNNGEKHNIAPAYGLFAFTQGDVLYVGHNGKYVGMLTFNGACFDGTIYPDATANDNLHFYFLGNATLSEALPETIEEETEITSRTISIADQSQNLPVLSYGASTKPFTGTGTTYSTTLKNKCALVRFDLQNQGNYVVTLSGVPTQATVNFANPTSETAIEATEGQTNGSITLYGESGNTLYRWAVLLPGTNLSTGHSDLNTTTYSGNVNLAELGTNDYVNSGISINNPLPLPDPPALAYAVKTSDDKLTQFSVSANKKVYFSKANLRYNESSGVWSFHDNQIDGCFGYVTGSTPQGYNVSPNGSEMDRFCWGLHSPTTTGESDYVDGSRNLNRTDGTDWGCALTGEGNNNWRTLTSAEWNYLLNNTSIRGSKRFMKVTIGPFNITDPNTNTTYNRLITGLFIAPDNFDPSKYSFTSGFASKTWNNTTCQSINIDDATILLEEAGCVFLPALGYRDSNGYQDWYYYSQATNYNFVGYYWSATGVQQNSGSSLTPQAEALQFDRTTNTMPSNNAEFRNLGMCVRLVWDAN